MRVSAETTTDVTSILSKSNRPFLYTDYENGELCSPILDCPFRQENVPCHLRKHGKRYRKTGPVHPLVILCCEVHSRYFSVYPRGFTPYARRQLVEGPVQHDVPSVLEMVNGAATDGPRPRSRKKPSTGLREGSWSTQWRWLWTVSSMLGTQSLKSRDLVASAFDLPLTQLVELENTTGTKSRATLLWEIFSSFSVEDMLAIGAITRCWGRPHRWLPQRDQLLAINLARGSPMNSGHPRGVDRT